MHFRLRYHSVFFGKLVHYSKSWIDYCELCLQALAWDKSLTEWNSAWIWHNRPASGWKYRTVPDCYLNIIVYSIHRRRGRDDHELALHKLLLSLENPLWNTQSCVGLVWAGSLGPDSLSSHSLHVYITYSCCYFLFFEKFLRHQVPPSVLQAAQLTPDHLTAKDRRYQSTIYDT